MRDEPKDLTKAIVAVALVEHWGLDLASLEYAPVGFGSYHWRATEHDGTRWFVTADYLPAMGVFDGGDADANFQGLRGALVSAHALRQSGLEFVVAPVPDMSGQVLRRLLPDWGLALYPYVDGEMRGPHRRQEAATLTGRLHRAAPPATIQAWQPALPHRTALDQALQEIESSWHEGPFSEACRELLIAGKDGLEATLRRYEAMAGKYASSQDGWVVTHGDSHGGNFIAGSDGALHLIDWDGARLAPPERDLQTQLRYDHEALAAYEAASGHSPRPEAIELFSIAWLLADTCVYVSRFRSSHEGSVDDLQSLQELQGALALVS